MFSVGTRGAATETLVGERRSRSEGGSASLELLGLLPYLLLAALFAWQILLAAFTAVNAENAARNGSRVEGRGGDGSAAAIATLSPFLQDAAAAEVHGEEVTVEVRVPIIIPAFTNENLALVRSAELPATD